MFKQGNNLNTSLASRCQDVHHKVLMTQFSKRNKKDWTSTVLRDIEELKLNMSIEEIKVMRKSTFSNILNKSMNEKAIEKLNEVKSKHSKVLHLKHEIMKMKKYLKANGVK